jgi:hypothetical protein
LIFYKNYIIIIIENKKRKEVLSMNTRKQIKQNQRKINKKIRTLNKNIAQDPLWKGRFVMHQVDRHVEVFEDKSGTYTSVVVILIDKKTETVIAKYIDFGCGDGAYFGYRLFCAMNSFIVEDLDVWSNRKDIEEDTTDYNKIKITDWNYYWEKRLR